MTICYLPFIQHHFYMCIKILFSLKCRTSAFRLINDSLGFTCNVSVPHYALVAVLELMNCF